jgi:hypothetical protein
MKISYLNPASNDISLAPLVLLRGIENRYAGSAPDGKSAWAAGIQAKECGMGEMTAWMVASGLFVVSAGAGIWLSAAGKPYGALLFNLHKLAALALTVMIGITSQGWLRVGLPPLRLTLLLFGWAALIGLFISGGLLGAGKLNQKVLAWLHRLLLMAVTIAAGLFLCSFEKG